MSDFDSKLLTHIGLTASAVGMHIKVSPQSFSNGLRSSRTYMNEARIASLQASLREKGEVSVLGLLEQFIHDQKQTPLKRFDNRFQIRKWANIGFEDFIENEVWLLKSLINDELQANFTIFTPNFEQIKRRVIIKVLGEMSLEQARDGQAGCITLIKIDDSLLPICYVENDGVFIFNDEKLFVQLNAIDSGKVNRGLNALIESPKVLTERWDTHVLPIVLLLQELESIAEVSLFGIEEENWMSRSFLNGHGNTDAKNWKLLAIRINPEIHAYKWKSGTPYAQLANFIEYISENTDVDLSQIKAGLIAIKLM